MAYNETPIKGNTMKNIFNAAFDRTLNRVRTENENDVVVDYNRKVLKKAVAFVAAGCAVTIVLSAVQVIVRESNTELSD